MASYLSENEVSVDMSDDYKDCNIVRFKERDIDLFLAEELKVNPEFSAWFVGNSAVAFDCEHPAICTEINVVEDGSEADVIATYRNKEGEIFRLFVENKITAQKMHKQLERYIRRAKNESERGVSKGWLVKLFAPRAYWDPICPDGVQMLSFEDAALALRKSGDDARISYKCDFLMAASVIRNRSERDLHNASTQPFVKLWWDTVYQRIEENFPGYFIHKTLYPDSVYFAPETKGFPRSLLRVDFKGHKGEVDLAFKNCNADIFIDIIREIPNVPGDVVVNKKSASLRISGLKPFVISDGISIIDERVIPLYAEARRLIEFWKENEEKLRGVFVS